jgi:prepilin-type processing-associated H-X9-DG protein
MLLPQRETGCYVFADVDDTLRPDSDPHRGRLNVAFGDYVWQLWRPYACCDKPDNAVALITHWGTYP